MSRLIILICFHQRTAAPTRLLSIRAPTHRTLNQRMPEKGQAKKVTGSLEQWQIYSEQGEETGTWHSRRHCWPQWPMGVGGLKVPNTWSSGHVQQCRGDGALESLWRRCGGVEVEPSALDEPARGGRRLSLPPNPNPILSSVLSRATTLPWHKKSLISTLQA